MKYSSIASRWSQKMFTAFVAATLVVSLALASDQPLPFTEDFLGTAHQDLNLTTADWGVSNAGVLQLGSKVTLENMAITGAVMGDGIDGPHRSRGIALGDFDGDGDLDAAVANGSGEINLVYENTGGAFTSAPADLGGSAQTSLSLAVGDIDNDGDLDIVVANSQSTNVYHLNDGTGNFGGAESLTLDGGRNWPIVLVDVENDGDLDVIVGQDQSRVNRLYRNGEANTGSLAFVSEEIGSDTFSTRAMAVGDVNGDGNVDLVTGDHAANNHLYYGDGNGGFDASVEVQAAQAWNTFALALADLNGDGALDLIEGTQKDANNLNGETRIYMNNLAGGFLAPTNLTGSDTLHTTVALLAIDVDHDGDIDIIEGNNGSWDHDNDGGTANVAQPNRLFLNNGAGVFAVQDESTVAADSEQTYGMAAGDIDGDGVLDFVAGNQTGENATYSLTGTASANPAVVQLQSVAQSTRVDDGSVNSRFGRLVIDPANINIPDNADIKFFLSNDGGAIFVPAPLDRPVEFPRSATGPYMWRAELTTSSGLQNQRPTVSELTVAVGEAFPNFQGPDTFSGTQGSAIVPVQVNFSDADGDRLTYTLGGLPAQTGLSIDANTGIITGTVSSADDAAAPITLTAGAFDGVRFRTGTITFTNGGPANQAPVVVTPIGDKTVDEGVAVNIDVSANFSDPDGDALTHTQTGLPASLTISAAGVITGTPLAGDVGTHTVTVTATDPAGAFISDIFTLFVTAANQAPVLDTPIGDQTATEGDTLNLDISGNFSDPDGDALTFTATGQPASITLSTAGVATGTLVTADVGTYNITVTATDPSGANRSDMFMLTVDAIVVPPPPPPPPPPRSGGGGGSAGLLELAGTAALLMGFQMFARRRRGKAF